ncbi:type 1 glutamine amidotransferase [Plebeiibacterium marinum]|uniref:Gamma-glutamyl-gamma-aminobutyrate hydrolase family protein n=1 Tax=Plebeiibacterium marinum TaxID=2992111 RepID=A0AAE3MHL1_9BACT|nr:gamma-glutamyl-gamma-aminobutyrate hydrolase family protein [Plebeiobacterium marinum]MCW3807807.1 gamma-glutamyl-gamma-aminobutyrate hydrolase family protein [Plebeiobacterium marinum]
MHVHWIQHVDFETLGNIKEWISKNNHTVSCTKQFAGDKLPDISSFDHLIVMGGPMGVYDTEEYPWLEEELQYIKKVIECNKPVLGICLGSQFIAAALGAKVYPGPIKEIGWHPIDIKNKEILSFKNNNPTVFHWHGDTFDLPKNAELIASTKEVPHQAYKYKNAIGLQFHMEQTEETIQQMVTHCKEELEIGGTKIQSEEAILSEKSLFESNKNVMFNLLDKMGQ